MLRFKLLVCQHPNARYPHCVVVKPLPDNEHHVMSGMDSCVAGSMCKLPLPAIGKEIKQMNVRDESEYPKQRSEEHTYELQSLMRSSYAVFCLKQKKKIMKKREI